jgi:hypothetical protein
MNHLCTRVIKLKKLKKMSDTIISTKKSLSNGISTEDKTTMKGLVYSGPGKIEYKEIPMPIIENRNL